MSSLPPSAQQLLEMRCEQCGALFSYAPSPRRVRRFCSLACAGKARKTGWKGETRLCAACGKEFFVPAWQARHTPSIYCSRACQPRPKRSAVLYTCSVCGKEFYRVPSQSSRTNYCSTACFGVGKHAAQARPNATCHVCGKEFHRSAKQLGRYERRYCSATCQAVGLTDRIPRTCEVCGKTFGIRPSGLRHEGVGRFCSRACRLDWMSVFMLGKPATGIGAERYTAHPYGPNWPTQSKLARKRDQYRCRDCGLARRRPALHVHHIVPRRMFGGDYSAANALDNLVTLCGRCHTKREWATLRGLAKGVTESVATDR